MDGILATLVSKPARSRRILAEEGTRDIQSVFGGDQMQSRLWMEHGLLVKARPQRCDSEASPVRCSLDVLALLATVHCKHLKARPRVRLLFAYSSG